MERFTSVYRRLSPAIHARCRRLLGSAAAADDACQEVFVRVYQNLDGLPSDRDVLRWAYRVSANVCISQLRKRRVTGESRRDSIDPGHGPEQLFSDKEVLELIAKRLPLRLVEPALLHYCDGIEQSDVGKMLGVSRRTVISRLNEFRVRAARLVREAG